MTIHKSNSILGFWTLTISALLIVPNGIILASSQCPPNSVIIKSPKDLRNIQYNLNGNYCQVADIDLAGVVFSPIGADATHPFTGIYDGNGFQIMNHKRSNEEVAIGSSSFAYAIFAFSSGQVRNVRLTNFKIKSVIRAFDERRRARNIAPLVGELVDLGSVSNCSSTGVVEYVSEVDEVWAWYVSGLVGSMLGGGSISNSSADVAIYVRGNASNVGATNIGGLVGLMWGGSVTDSFTTGSIQTIGPGEVSETSIQLSGGLVGETNQATANSDRPRIDRSYSAVNIHSDNHCGLCGGLIGVAHGTDISNSFASGNIFGGRSSVGVGGLLGSATKAYGVEGTIISSYAIGSVSGDGEVGGLIGQLDGTATHSWASGTVSGVSMTGGLVGQFQGLISDSYATGGVVGNSSVGGLVGAFYGGSIATTEASGNVFGHLAVGGLVGQISSLSATVGSSIARGNVDGSVQVGGLIGASVGPIRIQRVFAAGNISAHNSIWGSTACPTPGCIGGLVGLAFNLDLENAFSRSSVNAPTARMVGGLIGRNQLDLSNGPASCSLRTSYSSGYVNGLQPVGGLIGTNVDCNITASFWDLGISNQSTSAGGTARSTAQLQNINTFIDAGWNFTNIWILPAGSYPTLR